MIKFVSTTLLIPILLCVSCSSVRTTVIVPPNNNEEIKSPTYDVRLATIRNQSDQDLGIAVVNGSGEQLRGFGLGKRSKNKVLVEKNSTLVLDNASNQSIKATVSFKESEMPRDPKDRAISFVLRNNTAKSIPLLIPSVMNPNLSPFSNSGVDLAVGQEILFKEKGKRYVLLVVDDSIREGEKIDVAKLLKARKQELGL